MKTAISIPDDIFKAAEAVAKRYGLTRSELYARAVADYVEQLDRTRLTKRINDSLDGESSAVDPVLAHMQFASLDHEVW